MSPSPLRVLVPAAHADALLPALAASAFGSFSPEPYAALDELRAQLAGAPVDALFLDGADGAVDARFVESLAGSHAVMLVMPAQGSADTFAWFERGVQDVLTLTDLNSASLPQRLRSAIERKRHERETRRAYSTDLNTGLPHQLQLVEHMSHLLALREREPAPMALLVLRIEGLATTRARLGAEAAQVLRRKIAVRLRAGVRASDVVASLGDDSFAVLLASILAAADGPRVGAKLLAALNAPIRIQGQDIAVAAALGIAQYPEDGNQPDALLRRAIGLAASAQAQGRAGLSNFEESGGRAGDAANDA